LKLQLKALLFMAGMRGKVYKLFCFNQGLWLPLSQRGMRGAQPLGKHTVWGDLWPPRLPRKWQM